jgi:hypothetical protein
METVMNELYSPQGQQLVGGNLGNAIAGLVGGKSAETVEEVAYPEYVKNEDWCLFVKEFYLVKKITVTKSGSIYIIPPHKQLVKMIADFKKELEEADLKPDTKEAIDYASDLQKDFPFRRCIFKFFGDSTVEHYRIQSTDMVEFDYVKRTNELNEQYLFKYVDGKTIRITNDLDSSNDSEKGTTLCTAIAKCLNNVWIFQGELPEPKAKYNSNSLTGGALDKAKIDYFMQSMEEDPTAESFVSSMAIAAMEADKDLKPYEDDFSGNLIHSGFKICFDPRINTIPSEQYAKEDIRTMTQQLSKKLKSDQTFDVKLYVDQLEKIYKNTLLKNLKPVESTKSYVAGLKKFYKNKDALLKADIATALYQNLDQTTKDDISKIFDLVQEMENPSFNANVSRNEYEESSDKSYATSRLNYEIHDAIQNSPLIGLNAKTYTPSLRKYNFARRVNFGMEGGKKKSKKVTKKHKEAELPIEEMEGGDQEFDISALI